MKRKYIILLLILLVILFGIYIYFNRSGIKDISIQVDKDSLSNTDGNNINGGQLSVHSDWIYYINESDGSSLYKMDLHARNHKKVLEQVVESFFILDDWIYMISDDNNEETHHCISKINMNGTNFIKLNSDIASNLVVSKGWVYYSNKSDGGKIYRMDINGNKKQKICDIEPLFMTIYKDKLYFTLLDINNMDHNGDLYRVNIDGSDLIDLKTNVKSQINIVDSVIYYGFGDGLYKGQIDKKGNIKSEKIISKKPYAINVFESKIYFTNLVDRSKTAIYSIDTNGKNEKKLYQGGWIDNLYIIGNYLFFEEGSENSKLKVMKSDGKEIKTFINN